MNPGRLLLLIVGLTAIVVMAAALFDYAPGASESEDTDVIFLMGQSNAGYRTQTAVAGEAEPVPEPGRAFFYGTSTRPATIDADASAQAIWPMVDENGDAMIGDKWPAIAAAYTEATGHRLVMAQLSKVNTQIEVFDPPDGAMWTASVTRVSDVLEAMTAAGLQPKLCYVVWIQGESNRLITGEEYAERLLEIGTAIINGGLGIDVEQPILISKTRGTGGSVDGQEILTESKPGMFKYATTLATTFTVENGMMASDNLHYSQAGNNALGTEIGEAVAKEAKSADKMSMAIWGLIGIGIGAMVVMGSVAAISKD